MKYSTVIFDFGNVLIRFEPEKMSAKYTENADDAELVCSAVFDRSIWNRLDMGTITDEEVVDYAKGKLPDRLHEAAQKTYDNWVNLLPEVEGMRDIVLALKKQGCRVFILSNISKKFSRISSQIPIISLFDGAVYSAEIGLIKPHADIFKYICDKYNIEPCSALFIDDNAENIAGAKAFGLNTWHFKFDADKLSEYLFLQD